MDSIVHSQVKNIKVFMFYHLIPYNCHYKIYVFLFSEITELNILYATQKTKEHKLYASKLIELNKLFSI